MKLLICTQVVDSQDPILGFFHEWLAEFAKHSESIIVVCLRKGEYALPKNVEVVALGREFKFTRALEVCSIAFGRRNEYDAVFVHMNPEYLIAAGWLWRTLGKRIGLWYTHKSAGLRLRIAEFFARIIFTASSESFRLPSRKVHSIGHGIDTDFFRPDPNVSRESHFLSVGRLMKTKRHDLAIRAAHDARVALRIAGEGPEREQLESLAREFGVKVAFLGPLGREALRAEYRRAARLIHRSETGSLDKVVLEAAACGCPVESTDSAISTLPLSPEYVCAHHSLHALIPKILALYT